MAPNRLTVPPGLPLAVACTVMLVVGLAVVSVLTITAFTGDATRLARDHDKLTGLKTLQSVVEDAETANRGFVITGQEPYLTAYRAALAHYPEAWSQLSQRLSADERLQLQQVRPLITERIARLEASTRMSLHDPDSGRRLIEHGDGQALMDQIRDGLHGLETSIRRNLALRHDRTTVLARWTTILDLAGGASAIVILMVTTAAISRHWRRRLEAETRLREVNAHLERDVTIRTAELRQANQELESFSYSVSHDLRAPLRVITGLSEVLNRRLHHHLDEASRGQFALIIDNTRQMRELINDLLEFSRLGQQPLHSQEVDMQAIVHSCWDALGTERAQRLITFTMSPLPPCLGDAKLLRQVVFNLLANAIKYTRTRPEAAITVEAVRRDQLIEYRFRDNGVGFDMAASAKLFGVFQRLHLSSEFEGTGIGLAICRRIVERHHGTIWAHAETDRGATFCFTVPQCDLSDAMVQAQAQAQAHSPVLAPPPGRQVAL